mmetsp:Transcript_518/g.1810  ORF Transcript_518/g.1810 Transcript_518/m.1810 type:complete len:342 (-) Transcript_518:2139-3164(-)
MQRQRQALLHRQLLLLPVEEVEERHLHQLGHDEGLVLVAVHEANADHFHEELALQHAHEDDLLAELDGVDALAEDLDGDLLLAEDGLVHDGGCSAADDLDDLQVFVGHLDGEGDLAGAGHAHDAVHCRLVARHLREHRLLLHVRRRDLLPAVQQRKELLARRALDRLRLGVRHRLEQPFQLLLVAQPPRPEFAAHGDGDEALLLLDAVRHGGDAGLGTLLACAGRQLLRERPASVGARVHCSRERGEGGGCVAVSEGHLVRDDPAGRGHGGDLSERVEEGANYLGDDLLAAILVRHCLEVVLANIQQRRAEAIVCVGLAEVLVRRVAQHDEQDVHRVAPRS